MFDGLILAGAFGAASTPLLPRGLELGLIVGGLLLTLALALGWGWFTRRLRRDVLNLVRSLEDVRAGEPAHRPEVAPDSPLALVADSVNRLGRDVQSRLAEAERAADRWRALTDAAVDTAVITTDLDGDIHSFSRGAENLFGWEQSEVISRPAAVIFDENSYRSLLPKLARRALRKEGVTTRSKLLRRDGTTFDAETAVRSLTGHDGETIGFMMIVQDISSQIALETDLRRAEERYRGLIEELDLALLIVREGKIVFANPAAQRLMGRDLRLLLDRPLRNRIATRDVLVVEEFLAALQQGRSTDVRFACTLVDDEGGSALELRVHARGVEYDGARAVMLMLHDETQALRIEFELRSNESRLDAVMETVSDGILVFSEQPHGERVLMTNRAFAELFGLEPRSYLGLPAERLSALLRARGDARRVAELVGDASQTDIREPISLHGAEPRELLLRVAPLFGDGGERLGRVIACRDLTEQRRSERELQAEAERLQLSKLELEQAYRRLNEVNQQLEGRGAELDRLNQELQRLDEMKTKLLGNVSHELQTPLVSIRGYTEMVLKERLGPISEEQRKGLQLSLKNIDRLIGMIDNLVGFSRTGDELGPIRLVHFSLRALVEEAGELLLARCSDRGLTLDLRIEGQDMLIHADRDKIMQVFVNLLSNAIKFSHPGGSIEVEARSGENEDVAVVSVNDHGEGIPEQDLGRIFERHFQVRRPGERRIEGSGIGLAIVRDILRVHGSRIDVESQEGRGTRFSFTLPRVVGPSAREPGEARQSGAPPAEAREAREPAEGRPVEAQDASVRPRLRIIRRKDPEN